MSRQEIDVICTIEAGDWPHGDTIAQLARHAFQTARAEIPSIAVPMGEVSLLLTDDTHMRGYNQRWRGQDRPTNVLSFPAAHPLVPDADKRPLGDIVLALETLVREAEAATKPFEHHLIHLLIHGFLHLLGYDHETDEQAGVMEAAERNILRTLAIDDPYA